MRGVTSATASSLREANLSRALRCLHANPALTRADLTAALQVSRTTAAQVVGDLVAAGLLEERPAAPVGRRGRPTSELRFGPSSPVALAAEIGPAGMRVATIGLGRVVSDVVVLPVGEQPQQAVQRLGEVLARRCAALGDRVLGVGVALFGLVNRRGDVVLAPNLGWRDVPLADLLAEVLPPGVPVTVRNDASAAALYEARYGAGRDAGDVLYLYAGAGVGGGLTRRGHLVPGRQGLAGEVGHMLVNPATGRPCRCGRVGCWETEVNERALRERWSGAPVGPDDAAAARAVLAAAGRGDRGARQAVADTARWFAEGLGSLLNVLDPERVVLAGLFADLLRAEPAVVVAVTTARRLARSGAFDELVTTSTFGDRASLLGAGEHVIEPLLALGAPSFLGGRLRS